MTKAGDKIANLRPWKAGQSGNPAGKAKGTRNRSTIVREWLEAKASDGEAGQVADQLVRALIRKAAGGDVQAFKELMDSGFGKLTDKVENQHTYTTMGRVTISDRPLTFNVGKMPADHCENE